MHIGLAGPVDLRLLRSRVPLLPDRSGYSFPMTALLALEYVAQGHQVTVFALDPEAQEATTYDGDGLAVSVHPMRPRARDRAMDFFRAERIALRTAMLATDVDVIHAHWTYEFALAALRSGRPTTVTVHDWAPKVLRMHRDAYRAVRLTMQASVLLRAKHLTTVSPYLQREIMRSTGRRAELIPNGVSAAMFVGARTARTCPPVFGALNTSADPLKNVLTLVEAFGLSGLHASHGATLVLAGAPFGETGEFARMLRSRRIDAGIVFRGAVAADSVSEYLDSLDVFVHPSREESFGMVLLEAMARGLAVIAGQRAGAVPWLVGQEGGGGLTDVGDSEALSRKLTTFATDKALRSCTGIALLRRARDFDLTRVAERYATNLARTVP